MNGMNTLTKTLSKLLNRTVNQRNAFLLLTLSPRSCLSTGNCRQGEHRSEELLVASPSAVGRTMWPSATSLRYKRTLSLARRASSSTEREADESRQKRILRVVKNSKKQSTPPPPAKESVLISKLYAKKKYLLTDMQLNGLPTTVKRSSYLGEPEVIEYLESDCREASLKWLGAEKFEERMRTYDRLPETATVTGPFKSLERRDASGTPWYQTKSGKVVRLAIAMNGLDAVVKALAAYITGSKSLFAESIHALVDTSNQAILAVGLHQSLKRPDKTHPYGYASVRYVTSLISGVGILGVGCGMNVYHGVLALFHPSQPESLGFAFAALGCSLLFQATSAGFALMNVRKRAVEANTTAWKYVRTARDPSLNVVLMEDSASVVGVGVASVSVLLTYWLESPVPDAIGSIIIGVLLGAVARSVINSNTKHLVGQSIPQSEINTIIQRITSDPAVSSVHDVKATILGPEKHRFKAEIDFDGRNITRSYMDEIDVDEMLQEVFGIETEEDLRHFMMARGDRIIDRLGVEVDRIEKGIKEEHPHVRHVDLEAL